MDKTVKKYWPLFVLPTMAAFVIGFIVPFVYGLFLSFCKFTTVADWKWVGFKNYTKIFVVNGKVDTTFQSIRPFFIPSGIPLCSPS